MINSPKEAIARMCRLQAKVAQEITGFDQPNDCFCQDVTRGGISIGDDLWRNSGEAIRWIENLVDDAITAKKK